MTLSVVLINHSHTPMWVAQCLEYDIAAQGETSEDAMIELYKLLKRYVNEREGGLEGLPPAPSLYREQFDHAPSKEVMPSLEYAEASVA